MIYADNAATTRICEAAKKEITEMLGFCGNASSSHSLGIIASQKIKNVRETVKSLIGARDEDELVFTSGGSESNNHALYIASLIGKKRIIVSGIEHSSVFNTALDLEKRGFEIKTVGVDKNGIIALDELRSLINGETALVSVMAVNNEIGTVQPIKEIGEICKENGVIFHTDAVAAVGRMRIDVAEMNIGMLSLSAHKFGGMQGVGALYISKDIKASKMIHGGAQENNLRAGTENVIGILSLSAALKDACEHLDERKKYLSSLSNRLAERLLKHNNVRINGADRIEGLLNVTFGGINGEAMLLMLDGKGICASIGAACNANEKSPSRVLKQLGISDDDALSTVRFSLSHENTVEEIDFIADTVDSILNKA